MTRLGGAHVLVTGAAGGLGRLLALGAAARGARVTLLDQDATGLLATRGEIAGAGWDAAGYRVDLRDRDGIRAVALRVLAERGPVEVLVNNAGVVTGRPLLECSETDIERTFQVNALAPFWLVRAFLPAMLALGRGHLVTVASAAGLAGTARLTDYCASKFAAVGFDEALRRELRRLRLPVHTTVVCPWYIDTGMFRGARTHCAPLLPILRPEDVARRILRAVERDRPRLVWPPFLNAVLVARALPVPAYDAVLHLFGVDRGMDDFQGRAGPGGS